MSAQRKFRDGDVDDDLLEQAIEYAEMYRGDWPFLVAAQELVRVRGTLPITVARGVLNAMLADPEAHLTYRVPSPQVRPQNRPVRPERPHLEVVPDLPRESTRVIMDTRATVHHKYGMPAHRGNGMVRLHYVDMSAVWCSWKRPFRHIGGYDYTRWEPELVVHWMCGKRPARVVLFERPEQAPDDVLLCRKCEEAGVYGESRTT